MSTLTGEARPLSFKWNLEDCPSLEELVKFRQGKLPKKLDEDVTHHLTFCKTCSAKVTILQDESGETATENVELPEEFLKRMQEVAQEAHSEQAKR